MAKSRQVDHSTREATEIELSPENTNMEDGFSHSRSQNLSFVT